MVLRKSNLKLDGVMWSYEIKENENIFNFLCFRLYNNFFSDFNHSLSQYPVSEVSKKCCNISVGQNLFKIEQFKFGFSNYFHFLCRGVFVLWTRELMNQFLKNHQLNKAEIGMTNESILDWISGLQDTFSSIFLFHHQTSNCSISEWLWLKVFELQSHQNSSMSPRARQKQNWKILRITL